MVKKLKNAENETQILIDLEYGVKHWKNVKIEKSTLLVLNYGEKSDHKGKWETHIIGPGMCRETIKMWKMRNVQWRTWNMATNLKKSGKLDLDYGEIKDNRGKWDTNNAWPKIWRETLKNEKNEKCTLYELNYGKKTGQQGKWDTHMLRPEIWQETLKMWKMRIVHCRTWNMAPDRLGPGIWRKKWPTWKKETHVIGPEICRETLKNVKNEKIYTVRPGTCRENWKTWKMGHTHYRNWVIAK